MAGFTGTPHRVPVLPGGGRLTETSGAVRSILQSEPVPGAHPRAYPREEACGTLISSEGEEDRICQTVLVRHSPQERCPECKARRKKAALKRHYVRQKGKVR